MTRSRAALLVGAAALAAALTATLLPAPEAQAAAIRTPWWCISCGGAGVADSLLNLALLLPLGIALWMGGWTLWRATALCLGVTVAIELTQGLLIVGRDASLGDVVTNTAGGAIGWLASEYWRVISRPAPGVARAIAASLVVGLACCGVVAEHLLRPAMWRADFTRVRFSPAAAGRPTFPGTVTSFALNGAVYDDRSVPPALPPAAVIATTRLTWAPPRPGTATIVRIDGASGDAVFSLDVRGGMLRADVHTHASSLGLRSPVVGVPMPSSVLAGDTVHVEFRWTGNQVMLSVTAPGNQRQIIQGTFRPWHAWVLLNPFTGAMMFDWRTKGWTVAWLTTWLALIGWYVRRAMAG